MKRKCARCGRDYDRVGNTKFCKECAFLNRHRKCNVCGKIFVTPEGYIGRDRKTCFKCDPVVTEGKTKNPIDSEVENAKLAGMTYGKYQQWKYMQECQTNKMIKKLNKELKEDQ